MTVAYWCLGIAGLCALGMVVLVRTAPLMPDEDEPAPWRPPPPYTGPAPVPLWCLAQPLSARASRAANDATAASWDMFATSEPHRATLRRALHGERRVGRAA